MNWTRSARRRRCWQALYAHDPSARHESRRPHPAAAHRTVDAAPAQRVTEPLPEKPDQPRPGSLTEPSATQPLPTVTERLATEPLVTEPLPTLLFVPKPAAARAAVAPSTATEPLSDAPLLVGRGIACEAAPSTATEPVSEAPNLATSVVSASDTPSTATEPVSEAPLREQPVSEELVREEPAREAAVAIEEPPPATRAPFDSEPLRQLELLSAQIEQELRKSNPAYRPAPPPQLPAEPTEEPLELYLERFMEPRDGEEARDARRAEYCGGRRSHRDARRAGSVPRAARRPNDGAARRQNYSAARRQGYSDDLRPNYIAARR